MTSKKLPSSAEMRDHITLQAKRLRDRLGISLTGARNILAQSAYQCKSWDDLQKRVALRLDGEARLQLAGSPSARLREYLRQEEIGIARAIGSRVLANANLAGMLQTVRFVFEQHERDIILEDVVPQLRRTPWYSAGIGPDPYAVVQSFADINGQPIKLIGTRVYLPECMNFPEHLKDLAPYAANHGEPFSIMWSEPRAWFDMACRYLESADDDADDYPDFVGPQFALDESMRQHEHWFASLLQYWKPEGSYGYDNDQAFQPYLTPHGTYLVFGVPVAATDFDVPETRIDLRGAGENGIALAHLDGQAVSVESFVIDEKTGRHDGEFSEHFNQVSNALFRHPDFGRARSSQVLPERIYFVTPATEWGVEHALRLEIQPEPGYELVSIKTDRIDLLESLLETISAREVYVSAPDGGLCRYFATLDTTNLDIDNFSLSLDLLTPNHTWACNLVTKTVWTRQENRSVIDIELLPEVFSLIASVGNKTILAAARDGLVLRRESGFADKLQELPSWCDRFDPAPSALVGRFDYKDELGGMSPWELWSNMRYTRYRRDNF